MRLPGLILATIWLAASHAAAAEPAPSVAVTIRGRLAYDQGTQTYSVPAQGIAARSRLKVMPTPHRWTANLLLGNKLTRRADRLIGKRVVVKGILARIYDRKNRGYLLVVQVTGVAPAKASSE